MHIIQMVKEQQFTLGMPFLGDLDSFYRNRKGLNIAGQKATSN